MISRTWLDDPDGAYVIVVESTEKAYALGFINSSDLDQVMEEARRKRDEALAVNRDNND